MKRLLTTAAAAALLSHTPALAEKVVVTADRMLDVKTGKMVDYPAIFIGDDGRITSVADARTVRWSSEVRHIALPGKTLVPGLIDMHVHLDSPADIGGYRDLEYTDSFFGMTAVGNARAMLDAGFTTVRNVGSRNRNDIALKQAIEGGYAVGPADRAGGLCPRRDRRPLRFRPIFRRASRPRRKACRTVRRRSAPMSGGSANMAPR